MEAARARELLDRERRLIEQGEAGPAREGAPGASDAVSAQWDDGAEIEVDELTETAVRQLLERRRQALERAEGRLGAGTYGRSVASGSVIPDDRLEADPLAELTVEEEAATESPVRPF